MLGVFVYKHALSSVLISQHVLLICATYRDKLLSSLGLTQTFSANFRMQVLG